jgi:IclR family transcriptional regulator, pca regulon regulatory protein
MRINQDGEWVRAVPLESFRFSQSLERGLAILSQFSPGTPILGVKETADMLGLPEATTYRYMDTLVALGFLERSPDRRYRVTLEVTRLGLETMNSIPLKEHAAPLLQELRRETNFTVSMAVLDGPSLVYVERVRAVSGDARLPAITLGADLPAYDTALGKLLLAHLPTAVRRQRLGELTFAKTGPKSITSRKRLERELSEIREEGIALADEELGPGVAAVAAPVRDISGEVRTAISLAGDTEAIDADALADRLGPHLLATADRISALWGYRRGNGGADPHRLGLGGSER